MVPRSNSGVRRAIGAVALTACLLSLLTLLLAPLLRAHHFTARFRAPQEFSQIQRHIFMAQTKAGLAQGLANWTAVSAPFAAVVSASRIKPLPGFELAGRIPLPRLLLRLKLGSSRASSPDPLL